MDERLKFTLLPWDVSGMLTDRCSERREAAAKLEARNPRLAIPHHTGNPSLHWTHAGICQQTAIQENIEGDAGSLAPHQNRSSISAALPWLRGRMTSSRLRAPSIDFYEL